MSVLALAAVVQIAGACPAMETVPTPERAAFLDHFGRIVSVESGGRTDAVHRNSNGTMDAGISQLNSANWPRFGLTTETVFDPQRNICAGVAVLAEAYDLERRASCRYNAGKPDCANGYPEKVHNVHVALNADVPVQAAPPPPPDPSEPPKWDRWAHDEWEQRKEAEAAQAPSTAAPDQSVAPQQRPDLAPEPQNQAASPNQGDAATPDLSGPVVAHEVAPTAAGEADTSPR